MFFISYLSTKHSEFTEKVKNIYSEEFLGCIYARLSIAEDQRQRFRDYVVYNAVNYLNACENNKNRINASKQKRILKSYQSSLKEVKRKFQNIEEHDTVTSAFHASLREKIKETANEDIDKMFSPYMNVSGGDHEFWTRSEPLFNQFLDILIKAAEDAPKHVGDDYKTDLTRDFLFEWVVLMYQGWEKFTNVTFGLGDWLKGCAPHEEGSYKSTCADVLHDLLSAINPEIKKTDIETSMRKLQKDNIFQ